MIPINYVKGDATRPQGSSNKIIAHICNDIGAWGKGFVLAISNRWNEPERRYRRWYRDKVFALGMVQFVKVEPDIWIANMVAQHGIRRTCRNIPIRYNAVTKCLKVVLEKSRELNAAVHMPRIGCGLAGGKWERIEPIINQELCEKDIAVTVYDL